MEEQQWRSESVALDAPPTVQTTTVPAPKMPAGKQIPWKWVFGAGILVVALVAGLLFLKGNLAKNQKPTNNGQVKTQNVDLGKLAKNTTPLTLDKTDRVVINGQLQTTQGLVINPTAEPTTSVLGQVYLDSTTGDLRYYNGTTYLTIANSDAVGLTEVEVLALLTAFGTKLPQDLATTASPLFGGLKLSGTNGNAVLLQAAAGTANVTLTLPANGGTISQCLTTDGAGTLSFSACASGSGNAFLQGGNAFAATGVLGTTDNNDLNFITNNITRLTVAAGGNVGIGNATPGNKLSINSPTSPDGLAQTVIATGALANKGLVVQGVIFQSGSLLELQEHTGSSVFSVGATGNTSIRTATNSVTAFQVQNSAGSGVLNVDTNTSTGLVGIGIAPAYKLDVNGDINIVGSSALRIGGAIICTASGCDATSGSGSYIQNGNGIQSNANFGIQSANATYIGAKVRGAAGQSASLLELQISNATSVFSVGSTGNVVARSSADSATAFSIQNAAGTSNLLIADTNLNYVGIGIAPAYKLDVNGDINIVGTSALRIGGTIICTASGCDATSGSGSYIQNGNGIQPGANFGIQSANATYVGGVIKGAVSQSADLFQLQNSAGTNLFNVTATGAATFQNTSDTTGAFRVLDAAGTSNVLVVDTLNKRVGINTYPSGYALDVNGDVNLTSAVASLRITGTVVCNLSGCAASSGSGNYIQNGNGVQTNGNFAIQSANIGYVGGLIRGAAGQTADLLQIQNSGAANLFSVGATGNATFQNSADNSAAFNIKQSGGTTIFWADTLQGTINATNTAGNAFIGTTNNNLSYGVVGTQSFGVGGGVKGVGGGGYGVLGQSETNASGLFQTTNTAGTNTAATLVARANTNQSTNVFEVQNTAGTSVFGVSAVGVLKLAGAQTTDITTVSGASANSLTIKPGTPTTVATLGAATTLQGGSGNTTGGGGLLTLSGGAAGASGGAAGGGVTIQGTSGTAGSAAAGGAVTIQAGNGATLGTAGAVNLTAGTSGAYGGSTLSLTGGNVFGAGIVTLQGGSSTASLAGGAVSILGGNASSSGNGGNVTISGGTKSSGTPGSVIIKPQTSNDSTTAFQIQNAAGAQLLNIDSTNNVITIGGNNSAELQTWATTTALGATLQGHATASDGSFIYAVGGLKAGTITDEVTYAPLNANGTVGTWGTTTALPSAVKYPSISIGNGFMYVVGGYNSANTVSSSVFYGKINSNGTISSWTESQNKIITSVGAATTVATSGYLYVMGGGTTFSTVPATPSTSSDYARIYPDGSIGSFTAGTTLPLSRMGGAATKANGYMYFVGGADGSGAVSTIYMSSIPSDGTGALGAWSSAGTLNTARSYQGVSSSNGYLYAVGGGTPTVGNSSVEYGTLGSNGSVSGQTTATNALSSTAANYGGVAVVNGYFYVVGGVNSSGTALTTVQYSSAPRIKMAGSLDLVGISGLTSGSTLSSSGTGGSLTAGDTNIIGKIRVTGSANFLQNMAINGDFYAGGNAVFRSTTNSSTAFQIQNSSGSALLYADTINNFVNPGISSTLSTISLVTAGFTIPLLDSAVNVYGMALARDGKAVFSYVTGTSNSAYIIKCTTYECPQATSTTSGPLAVGEITAGNSQAIVTYNGNPMLFYRNATLGQLKYIKCGNVDCTSGNTPAAIMHSSSSPGVSVNAIIGPDGYPYIAHRLNTPGDLAITRCTGNKLIDPCSASSTTAVSTTSNVGTSSQMDRGGCFVGDNSSNCVVLAHLNIATDQVQISVCTNAANSAAITGGFNTCTVTVNTNIPVTGAGPTSGGLSMFVVNGLPTIVRLLSTGNIEVFRCANVFCTAYTHNAAAVTGASVNGMNAIIGKNGNPLITYSMGSTLHALQCGNATCTAGNTTNNSLITLGSGNMSNAIIAGDGFPLILSTGAAGANPDINMTHCIDASCTTTATSAASGGVLLGSKPSNSGTEGMFQGLFTQSINNGIQNASFSYGMDGTVVANALSSDTSGNVLVSSVSATALKVMNSNTSDTVLSVDSSGTTNSVNIGTSTSVAGYGFNSAAASLFRNTTNSTSAFSVENLSSQSILKVDTSAGIVSVGSSSVNANVLLNNSTNANTLTLQSGATASTIVLTLPTTAGSVGDCLQSNGFGVLSFNACTGGAGGGVTSIAGQIGVVTVNNATGSGGVLTIDDASTSAKGIASFNSTNFSVSSGAVNTIQNINTGATPQFAGVLANSLDRAAAGTLTIGGSTQTAISLGRAGITTTNAGALTVSQLLTAGLANSATLGNTGLAVSANADIDGIVAIGSGATPNAFYALGIFHDFTATNVPAGCPNVYFFGNVCSGVYATVNSNGLTGLTDNVTGGSFGTNNTGSTVLENAYGLIVRSATNSSSGSIVSAVGLSVAPQTVGTSLNLGVTISTSSTTALQLGSDLATPTAYNSGVSFGYDNDTVLFRTAAGQLAVGTAAGATTLKLSPTAITSTGGLTINTTTSSTLTLDSGTTGAVNIGNSANAKAVTVGSSTGGSSLTLQAGTGTIGIGTSASTRTVNIATGAAAQTVTLGSSTGASSLLLASGTGGITFAGHIISGNSAGSTATAFAVGAAACTGGVATSSAGNDTAGKIVVTTGASGCAAGTIVTVTFGTTYTTAPMVVVTPGDSVTAGENLNYFATPAATTFVLGTQTTTTISKTLTFYYHVIR